jgi:hypothetical protein
LAIVAGISGTSGSGKSTSFRNMDWNKTFIVRCGKKPLPFQHKLKQWDTATKTGNYIYSNDYAYIRAVISKLPEYGFESIIIDDSTFLMTDAFMSKIEDKGFEKWSVMANDYYLMLKTAEGLDDNVRVYIVNHTEETVNGDLKIKTVGKLLDNTIDIPSLFTIALGSAKTKDGYKFRTQTSGRDFYKSPMGLFDKEFIDNDLAEVDKAIVTYYDIETKSEKTNK